MLIARWPVENLTLTLWTLVLVSSPCSTFNGVIPRAEHPDYVKSLYETKRKKELDCSCGEIGTRDLSLPFPWHVLITHRDTPIKRSGNQRFRTTLDRDKYCSGTLINDRVILTSISCILKLSLSELKGDAAKGILFQQDCLYQPEELRVWLLADVAHATGLEVAEFYFHPEYLYHVGVHSKTDFDIALLTLKSPLEFRSSSAVPVCLPRKSFSSVELEGVDVSVAHIIKRDRYVNANASTSMSNIQSRIHTSPIYSLMRCRINAETRWISDRLLCTQADQFSAKLYNEVGTGLVLNNGGKYVQLGILSWTMYNPLLRRKVPLVLSTNVAIFLKEIEEFSEKMGGKWCTRDWNSNLSEQRRWVSGSASGINDEIQIEEKAWKGISSNFRNTRSDCVCGKVNSIGRRGRIQGGVEATPYEYGWMVQLLASVQGGKQLCGGALINSKVILTAAHCVYKKDADAFTPGSNNVVRRENMIVRIQRHVGPIDRDDHSRVLKVEAVIPHPEYSRGYVDNDVALLILKEHLDYKKLRGKVSPLCLPMTDESIERVGRKDAKVVGWGRTSVLVEGSHAKKLQELEVEVISLQSCIDILDEYYVLNMGTLRGILNDESKLCAGTFQTAKSYKDLGHGDSGGPLFLPITPGSESMVHIGIASFITMRPGDQFLESNLKTVVVYSNVSEFLEFFDYHSLIADATWCIR